MAQGIFLKEIHQLIDLLTRFAREIYHTMRPTVTLMSGPAKQSNDRLTICYVGNMPRGYRLGFPTQSLRELDEEVDLGAHWVWQLRKLLNVNKCDFAMLESSPYLRRILPWLIDAPGLTFFLPFFVQCLVDITDPSSLLRNNSGLKRDIRRIRKSGFTLQVSSDIGHYQTFLDSYYRPYMASAHGALAALFDYGFLCRADYADHKQWELLQIILDDEWVAGALVRKDDRMGYLMEIGVKNADVSYVKRGALTAVHWLFLQRMLALGYRQVSFMWSAPFLQNGVLQFKKKYCPELEAAPTTAKGILLVPLSKNRLCRRILLGQPMIQLEGSALIATCLEGKSENLATSREQLLAECRRYRGISNCKAILLGS
jgi:GNAT acetyltransferase-like protein